MKRFTSIVREYWRFLVLLLFLLVSVLILEQTKTLSERKDSAIMRQAAVQTEAAFAALKEEKLARGYTISPIDDPNATGMIGEPYTEITTTLGNLESKRSTTNPNTAAMIVLMLRECGVQEGDRVAVNLSSSFPCLNISILCALDAIGAQGTVINSVGSSTYGANLPDFTYLDMEQVLLQKGLITNHTSHFSLGGAGDLGKEMPEEIKNDITNRLKSYGLTLLSYEDINENIQVRQSIYENDGTPVCLVNAGGNLLAFNGGDEMISAPGGIIRPETNHNLLHDILPGQKKTAGSGGLIPLYLERGVPAIHLLNMRDLLPSYGLPFDPSPIPAAGEGQVYDAWQYNLPLAGCLLTAAAVLLLWAARHRRRKVIPL